MHERPGPDLPVLLQLVEIKGETELVSTMGGRGERGRAGGGGRGEGGRGMEAREGEGRRGREGGRRKGDGGERGGGKGERVGKEGEGRNKCYFTRVIAPTVILSWTTTLYYVRPCTSATIPYKVWE